MGSGPWDWTNLNNCDLDIKNPSAKEDLEHLLPEKLVEDIAAKERRILEIMGRSRDCWRR